MIYTNNIEEDEMIGKALIDISKNQIKQLTW